MIQHSVERRFFLKMMTPALILAGTPNLLKSASPKNNKKPNVILILSDDQGYADTGIHGNKLIDTKYIDSLAKDGCEFTRFYVEPVCAPTRASLLTGRYYYRTGVIHTSRGGAKMAGDETTIAELLKNNGYKTAMFGKWHLGDNYPMRPQDQGFEETLYHRGGGIGQTPDQPNSYLNPLLWKNGAQYQGTGYCTDIFFDKAIGFIQQNKNNPFFVYVPTNTPHTPLEISNEYEKIYTDKGLDKTTAKVYGMIKNIDDNFGRLLSVLKNTKLEKETLIIYISDNGANTDRFNVGLRQRKASVYEGGIRAISFFKFGKNIARGKSINSIAAHIDIFPTILDVCGITKPPELRIDGRSIYPFMKENSQTIPNPERTLFIQCHRGLGPKKYQNCAAITRRYKMVGNPGTFNNEELEKSEKESQFELYDIENDMGEKNNLAEEKPLILKKLLSEYNAWFNDVKASRHFKPGIIKLGSSLENPATLCRYQDSSYLKGIPFGWHVEIVRGGEFELSINRGPFLGPGSLVVKWQGGEQKTALTENGNNGVFQLTKGLGTLEIWFELDSVGRITFSNNGTIGDVIVTRL